MSEEEHNPYRSNGATPITVDEMRLLLRDHQDKVDYRLSDHHQNLEHRVDAMSTTIVNGFDKVGDKIVKEIQELQKGLIPAATNSDRINVNVIMPIIYTLCGVITSLIVWFTGVKPFLPTNNNEASRQHVEQPYTP